jgi:hypothetical protein
MTPTWTRGRRIHSHPQERAPTQSRSPMCKCELLRHIPFRLDKRRASTFRVEKELPARVRVIPHWAERAFRACASVRVFANGTRSVSRQTEELLFSSFLDSSPLRSGPQHENRQRRTDKQIVLRPSTTCVASVTRKLETGPLQSNSGQFSDFGRSARPRDRDPSTQRLAGALSM